jgi:hypothetical protein
MTRAVNSKMVLIPLDRYEELTSSKKKAADDSHENRTDQCDDNLSEDNILEFIPTHFQNKAKLILRHLKTHEIKWDNCGRLVMDNDCVVNANIIEILKDVVSTNNNKIESNASKQFYKLLILTNFPVSLLNLRDGDNTESSGENNSEKSLL